MAVSSLDKGQVFSRETLRTDKQWIKDRSNFTMFGTRDTITRLANYLFCDDSGPQDERKVTKLSASFCHEPSSKGMKCEALSIGIISARGMQAWIF